jgi:hypothetical protein
MPVEELKGATKLRTALKNFTTDFAYETQIELGKAMAQVAAKGRGYMPSSINLSGWQEGTQGGKWASRAWSASEARDGVGYSTTPSKPNRKGFTTLARIVNASAAGAIYETAGRKNPEGRKHGGMVKVVYPLHPNFGKMTRAKGKNISGSNNPFAGMQFIDAMNEQGLIVDANSRTGAGRMGRKMKGRAIFRAWKEDGGRTNAAVNKAILASRSKFYKKVDRV